jgi:hypothetical protein
MKLKYLETPGQIPLIYLCQGKSERRFITSESIHVELSDGSLLIIEKGFETDLSSVPGWLWSFCRPIDRGLIGDLIHDKLWTQKQVELERFDGSIYLSRKFADDERHRWRTKLVPHKWIKNHITHRFIRWFGGLYYSRQLSIPD